ncbi:hypothetical protein DMI72_00475 [Akkermansia muciniphila]|nr:hypothetical protein DMI72_00475 [Akkermansia muciniphila]
MGGKEGAFAPEDHSEQQPTLKGRLPKKMDLPTCTGIHHIHLLPSRYPEMDHRNCSGRQHRRGFPMASRKRKVLPAGNRFRLEVHAKGWNSAKSAAP